MGIDKKKIVATPATELRRHAEEQLCAKPRKKPAPMNKLETQRSVHELEVHQVELEMQNEDLRDSQNELEVSLKMFEDLYDYAPFGYFTFDMRGVIQKTNYAGAELLSTERELLKNVPFTNFITDEGDRTFFLNHLTLVSKRKTMLRCEIKIYGSNGSEISCQLQGVAVSIGKNSGYILSSVVDNTVRKYFEAQLQQAHNKLEELVIERTKELVSSNMQLELEVDERKKAEKYLQSLYAEIKQLKDQLEAENIYLEQEVAKQYNFGEIIGQSSALSRVFAQIQQVAPMNATVLLLGETGTGKGVVARAIHGSSTRKSRPLITVNCATLPATLVESELFGRERGAFTGSDARQIGRFELADGGTIFLDEIGELPLELQCKLLRVIQDGEFERLGSPRTIKTDVRIIAATNRKLDEEIKNGKFREDLYYRLNVFPITMPPLRERKEDIPLLVNHFIAKFNNKIGKKIDNVSRETLNTLAEYHWPGNVRELESVIERAVIISPGASLQVLDRFDTFTKKEVPQEQDIKALVELEHDHILQVLQKVGWRIEGKNGAAGLLGLNASTLRARMRKYGIVRQ
jgi:PAS domain S-box-containing protein